MSTAWVEGRYDGSVGFIYTPSGRCFFKIEVEKGEAVMRFHNQSIPKFEGSLVAPVATEYLRQWVAHRKETT